MVGLWVVVMVEVAGQFRARVWAPYVYGNDLSGARDTACSLRAPQLCDGRAPALGSPICTGMPLLRIFDRAPPMVMTIAATALSIRPTTFTIIDRRTGQPTVCVILRR